MVKLLLPYAAKQRSPEKLIEHDFFQVVFNGSVNAVRHYLYHDRSLANVYLDGIFDISYRFAAYGFDPNISIKLRVTPAHLLLLSKAMHGSVFSKLKCLLESNADFEIKSDAFTSDSVTPFQLAMIRGRYIAANFLAESGCVNIHNVHQLVNLDLVEQKIDELCTCKRWFSVGTSNDSLKS